MASQKYWFKVRQRNDNGRWRIRCCTVGAYRDMRGSYASEAEARAKVAYYEAHPHEIDNLFFAGGSTEIALPKAPSAPPSNIWEVVINKQKDFRRSAANVVMGNQPVAIAFISDLHFGSAGTDYQSAYEDAQLIANTDGMYAVFHGDGIDNWIVPKLQSIQRYQAVNGDEEIELFFSWLDLIKHKLLVVVAGNHDNWTKKMSGLDMIQRELRNTKVIYDPNEVRLHLYVGDGFWRIKIRHKWRYGSIYNPTHGIEVGWDRGDWDFDIGVAGHTHIGTLFRSFIRHNQERLAVITGAYKMSDHFATEIGFAQTNHRGCGAVIFKPNGSVFWTRDLREASEYVTWLRSHTEY